MLVEGSHLLAHVERKHVPAIGIAARLTRVVEVAFLQLAGWRALAYQSNLAPPQQADGRGRNTQCVSRAELRAELGVLLRKMLLPQRRHFFLRQGLVEETGNGQLLGAGQVGGV